MKRLVVLLIIVLLWGIPTKANTITAASCSVTDVNTAITSSVDGDTVKVPGPCSVNWTPTLTWTKGITLDGGGNVTITNAAAIFGQSSATVSMRITGFIFTNGGNVNNGDLATGGHKGSNAPFRIDHNTFFCSPTCLVFNGNAPGLVDHNTFTGPAAAEMIHNNALGAGQTAGWTDDIIPGSINAVYLEDNTFNCTNNTTVCSIIQGYYGARTVLRHNAIGGAGLIDMHGTCGNVYARWWEVYENTWTVNPGTNQYAYIGMRGGSGVIFNNHLVNGQNNSGGGGILFIEDCSSGTYPITDQIGRGINQDYSPAYAWNNDAGMNYGAQGSFVHPVDFFTSANQPATMIRCEAAADGGTPGTDTCPTTYSYVPFPYPHPLQSTSPIPSTRSIDWTHVGIPGGIPSANWPINAVLSPSGTADDSVAIQAAIAAAPLQSVVFLNSGVFKLHRGSNVCQGFADDFATGFAEAGLCINKNIALRGSGPGNTIIQYGDGANIISLGQLYLSSSNVVFIPITAGSTKGSTQITLSNVTNITPNSYITVSETNPLDSDGNPLVNTSGYTGSCSSCGHSLTNNAMSQIDKVTAVNGLVVTLERPLYFDYLTSPVAYHLPMTEGAGLENLRLQSTASSGTLLQYKNINMMACAHCWVHDVESDFAVDKSNMYMSDVYSSEISDNYFNDGYSHASGASYEVFAEWRVSETLIQNNIIRKARHPMIMNGTSGNVWAYNYDIDAFMSDFPNSLPGDNGHGAHGYMNLFEGNTDSNFEMDFAHGSASHNSFYRNYANVTSTNPNTGLPMTGALFPMNMAYYSNYMNIFGNIIGQYPSGCTLTSYQIKSNASQNPVAWKIGYFDDGGTATPNQALTDKVENTMLRGGNWDCFTNTVVWNNNVPGGSLVASYIAQQVLPASLYLSAKPAWFNPQNAVFPSVDPAATTKVNKSPAQLCYESGPAIGGAFNPTNCYVAAGPPPSNIRGFISGNVTVSGSAQIP